VHQRPVNGADELVRGDLDVQASLDLATEGADAVLHLAALTHARNPRRYEDVNASGTRRLLESAAKAEVRRFVHVSTRAITQGGGAYSRSKASAERAVADFRGEHAIVRLPEVYGAGSREGVDRIVEQARAGASIPLVGRGSDQACPVFVEDVLDVLVAALRAPVAAGRTYTLAGECMTLRELAERCMRFFRAGGRVLAVPVPLVRVLGALGRVAPLPIYPDQLARLRARKPAGSADAGPDLGFAPRSLEQGLATMIGGPSAPAAS